MNSIKPPGRNFTFSTGTKLGAFFIFSGVLSAFGWSMWRSHQILADSDAAAFHAAEQANKQFRGRRDYDSAIAQWEDYRTRPWPRNYMYEADLNEAALWEVKQDYKAALGLYQEAEKYHKGDSTAEIEGIARTAERLGNVPLAAQYYAKAAEVYFGRDARSPEGTWMQRKADDLKQKEQTRAS